MSDYEYELYSDFRQAIKEAALEYGIQPSDYLIKYMLTRVDQNTVRLYEEWGLNDTEFVNSLQNCVKESLLRKGFSKEVFGD